MGTKSLKPRNIVTAMHLQETLEDICRVLNGFKADNIEDYKTHSLCLNHFGKVQIQQNEKLDALYSIPLQYCYHILLDYLCPEKITDTFIDYQRCIVFTKQMICESMYDLEYSRNCCSMKAYKEERPDVWQNESEYYKIIERVDWVNAYRKKAESGDFNQLMMIVEDATEIRGIHLSFLKEYLLEQIFDVKGYMPKRYDEYRYDYKKIFDEQIKNDKVDELIDKGLELKGRLKYAVFQAMPENNLFTEAKVDDIVNHIINMFVSYHYYELGKNIILRIDTN